METSRKIFSLTAASCDEIAALVEAFCGERTKDRKEALRYRLSAEECLLFWLDRLGEGTKVTVSTGRRLLTFFVSLEAEGKACNPYQTEESQEEFGSSALLSQLGLKPEYSFTNGRNRVFFRLKRKSPGQLATLGLVMAAALAVGLLGQNLLPEGIRAGILDSVILPVYDTFFNLLSCIAGPMIFLSVAWGIYGIGDAATFGRIGRKVMLRYVRAVFLATACCTVVFPLLGPGLSAGNGQSAQAGSILRMLLDIFPSNIVEPFISGNTMQIIFLAIVVGIALLYLGQQTSAVARAIEQINYMVQFLMRAVSSIVPYVIFLVVIQMIWSGNIWVLGSMWKAVLVALVCFVFVTVAATLNVSRLHKVSPLRIVRKSIPTFLIAIVTASSAAAFSSNVSTCQKKFGINSSLVSFGVPLGMVIHKPIAAIYDLLIVFYFARVYDVPCSPAWIVTAAIIAAVIAIATPPIPGGGALAYTVLFHQMGIPDEALAVALAVDILADFVMTAFEMYLMPLTLMNAAGRLNLLDLEVLRSE